MGVKYFHLSKGSMLPVLLLRMSLFILLIPLIPILLSPFTQKNRSGSQIGDILFCMARSKELKLAEKPTEFSQIARVKCRKSDGPIVEIPAYNLRKISSGNYYGEFLIEGLENEKRAKELEIYAKYYGFRAEYAKIDKAFLLKIYGDSQQEVDVFHYTKNYFWNCQLLL